MAALTVGGVTYAVVTGDVEYEPLNHPTRAFSGAMRTAKTGTLVHARNFPVNTDILTTTEADTLEEALRTPGTFTIDGEIPGEAITCIAEGIERFEGPLEDMAAIHFIAREVG